MSPKFDFNLFVEVASENPSDIGRRFVATYNEMATRTKLFAANRSVLRSGDLPSVEDFLTRNRPTMEDKNAPLDVNDFDRLVVEQFVKELLRYPANNADMILDATNAAELPADQLPAIYSFPSEYPHIDLALDHLTSKLEPVIGQALIEARSQKTARSAG